MRRPTPTTSSWARAPAAEPWPRGWPRRASPCWCSRRAAIRGRPVPTTTTSRRFIRSRPRTTRCGGTSSSGTTTNDAQQQRDPKYRATEQGQAVDGVLYPRAGDARRLHGAQRDDPRLPARCRLESARRSHRRSVVARRADAHATSSGSRSATIARSSVAEQARAESAAATAGAAGCTTEHAVPEAVFNDPRPAAHICQRPFESGLHEFGPPDLARLAGRSGPERRRVVARQRRRPPLHAADDEEPSAERFARAVARCGVPLSRPADDPHCTRWRRACCSTIAIARSASSIWKANACIARSSQPSNATGERTARARGAAR